MASQFIGARMLTPRVGGAKEQQLGAP